MVTSHATNRKVLLFKKI